MALANIFTKLSELEKKIQSFSGTSLNSVESSVSSGPDVSELLNKLAALESAQLQSLERIAALESSQSQVQQQVNGFSSIVNALETAVPSLNNKISQLETVFLDKLNHIETVVFADLNARVLVLEEKMSEL